jgi:hypothetical protein
MIAYYTNTRHPGGLQCREKRSSEMFEIRERGTNQLIGTRATYKAASAYKDKLDNAFGAYHYYVKEPAQTIYGKKA